MSLVLVGGGCRSGKSRFSMKLALQRHSRPIYLATAQSLDGEMERRIAIHKSERSKSFTTIEESLDLIGTFLQLEKNSLVLVDCLTLWITNRLMNDDDDDSIVKHLDDSLKLLKSRSCASIWVSNEVGMGIMPMNALSRRFADLTGWCHQMIADRADEVFLTMFGQPVPLKSKTGGWEGPG